MSKIQLEGIGAPWSPLGNGWDMSLDMGGRKDGSKDSGIFVHVTLPQHGTPAEVAAQLRHMATIVEALG